MPSECDALCWGFAEFQPTPREHLSRRSTQVFFARSGYLSGLNNVC